MKQSMKYPLIIIMGVSGCGKSTAAKNLSKITGWRYLEADDYHSKAAKQKMAAGQGLSDADREPWIARLCNVILGHEEPLILAYSGLRRVHRNTFLQLPFNTQFIHLTGSYKTIASRMANRQQHFAPAALLTSQFDALEPLQAHEPHVEYQITDKRLKQKIRQQVMDIKGQIIE